MTARAVIDPSGNFEESIERLAQHLGRGKVRRAIFNVIYGRGEKPKSVDEIMPLLGSAYAKQSIINEMVRLGNHHLVAVTQGEASGRRKLYSKDPFVRANRDLIVKCADDPKKLKRLPTKRRPTMPADGKSFATTAKTVRNSNLSIPKAAPKLRILFLTATPASQEHLRTDAEVALVQEELRGSKHRDRIDLLQRPAASAKTLLDGLNDHSPQVVHFSGHGGNGGIWFDDGKVEDSVGGNISFDLLAEIFEASSNPPVLLVLNSCDTLDGAQRLLGSVQMVIAMSSSVSDIGAATFASQLYAAIASGETVLNALKQGRAVLRAALLDEDAKLPEILSRDDIDPSKVRLVR